MIAKCVAAAPRHGQVWQVAAKDPKNAGKNTKEVLQLVAAALS